jgi:hypothetical protein
LDLSDLSDNHRPWRLPSWWGIVWSGSKFTAVGSATLGFSDKANLDEGHMWPTAFALKELTAAEEAKICALVKKAVS